jgi:DNA processing protein
MSEILDLIRISKSSILSKLFFQGFSPSQVIKYSSSLEEQKNKTLLISLEKAEEEIELAKKLKISLITIADAIYPEDLKRIQNPPLILYAKGDVNLLSNPKFAIVGARSASVESLNIAQNFGKQLSESGFTIVSGFAFGVDTASCIGSYQFGTIQVLGSGVDKIYPKENRILYEKVLENGGLFLSELPPNSPVKPENFPLRNRIISGISKGVLLIQASRKNGSSGSLITAKIALEQEKDLFAIPGHPLDDRFDGNNELLKNGSAIFTTHPQDVLDMIGYHLNKKEKPFVFRKTHSVESILPNSESLEVKTDVCEKIKDMLGTSPISIDEMALYIKEDVRDVQIAITQMELLNEVRKHRNGCFSLNLI